MKECDWKWDTGRMVLVGSLESSGRRNMYCRFLRGAALYLMFLWRAAVRTSRDQGEVDILVGPEKVGGDLWVNGS